MEEKDLGVFVSNNFRWKKQITIAAAKANMVLGQIKKKNSFAYLDYQTLRPLLTALVRPHL